MRYSEDQFEERGMTTLGVDYKVKTIESEGEQVRLQVWDTAGQERFGNVTSSFYRGAHIIVVVYDVSSKESYESVENWLKGIDTFSQGNLAKIVLGNKSDLPHQISLAEAKEGLSDLGVDVLEVSAKDGTGVEEAFAHVASLAIRTLRSMGSPLKPAKGLIKLDRRQAQTNKKCNC